jgi:hypothetical protein
MDKNHLYPGVAMKTRMSSRERLLAAIRREEPDYVPLSFMIFNSLRETCRDGYEFVDKQLALGLDAVVPFPMDAIPSPLENHELRGLPVSVSASVKIRDWKETDPKEHYPLLHREYQTPAGNLEFIISQTEDYIYGDTIPFINDYTIPRGKKQLVEKREDLKALKYLLAAPTHDEIAVFTAKCKRARAYAKQKDLLTMAWRGIGIEGASWVCGLQELVMLAMDDESFAVELAEMFHVWNSSRMEVYLDQKPDLFVRRAWYEGPELFSPDLYRKLVLPYLTKEVKMAHQAGAAFGYIITSSQLPVMDQLREAGVDVIIGIDPVVGKGAVLPELKKQAGKDIALWGGINGCVTVEQGTKADVEKEVEEAFRVLAPGGGFIMSPVDNIHENTPKTWENIRTLIAAWQRMR